MPHPLTRLALWCAKHPWVVLACHAALLLAVGIGLSAQWRAVDSDAEGFERLALQFYDNDLQRVWTADAPAILAYEAFLERWGSDELALAVAEGPAPLRPQDLDQLAAWAAALDRDEVYEVDVVWAGQLPYAPESLVFGDPVQTAELAPFLAALSQDEGAQGLLSVDEERWSATLLVRFAPGLSDADRAGIGDWLREVAAGLEAPPGEGRAAMGTPVLLGEVRDAIFASLVSTLRLSNLVVLLCCVLVFRRLRMVPLVLAGVLQGEALAIGLFLLCGRSFNYVSCFMATAIIVVGFAANIHLFTRYAAERGRREVLDALSSAAEEVAHPSATSLLTTCAALLALTSADQAAIVDFGLFTAIGTVLVLACTYTLGPALLRLFDQGPVTERGGLRVPSPAPIGALAWRNPWTTLGAVALLSVVALVGAKRLALGSSVRESFVASSALAQEIQFVEDHGPGLLAFEVELSWPGPRSEGGAALSRVAALEAALAEEVEVRGERLGAGRVMAVSDLARSFCLSPGRGPLCEDGWPKEASAAALVDEAMADPRVSLLQHDGERWWAHLTLLTDDLYAHDTVALAAQAEAIAGRWGAPHVTGMGALWGALEVEIVDDLIQSFVRGAAVVALLLLLVLRGGRLFAAAVPANALPLLGVAGGAGWLFSATGTHVSSTAAMFLTVTIGLVVDDTLFFLLGFKERVAEGVRPADAVRETLDEAGPGIVVTSLCLALGFATMLPGSFINARVFGGLTSATVLLALAADLFILPACCRLIWGEGEP